MFCGKYQTEIPEGYFEHLDELRGKKKRRDVVGSANGQEMASSGPLNEMHAKGSFRLEVPANTLTNATNNGTVLSASTGPRTPENREDIR